MIPLVRDAWLPSALSTMARTSPVLSCAARSTACSPSGRFQASVAADEEPFEIHAQPPSGYGSLKTSNGPWKKPLWNQYWLKTGIESPCPHALDRPPDRPPEKTEPRTLFQIRPTHRDHDFRALRARRSPATGRP